MRRPGRIASAVGFAVALVVLPASPALAHGGSKGAVTSDYRVVLTAVTPQPPGLSVRIIDVGGTPQLTWKGAGSVIVDGYSGEPYLRISPAGVERNERSPATYLNQTRYATSIPPASADATAPAEWKHISDSTTVAWHDHRTHWMSPIPPEDVSDHPGATTIINPDWQIPLIVDGAPVVIHGSLEWVPPPTGTRWLAAGVGLGAILTLLLLSRWWRRVAAIGAVVGTSVYLVDSFGYVHAAASSSINVIWTTVWPVVAVAAMFGLIVELRSRPSHPPLSLFAVALVLAVVGGFDRVDSVTSSQIYSSWPDWSARCAATICLAISGAFMIRFAAYLVPTLIVRPAPVQVRRAEAGTGSDR